MTHVRWPALLAVVLVGLNAAAAPFAPPQTPRRTFDFNPGWRFIRQDVAGAYAESFDDAGWAAVSTPHTWNGVDSYRQLISHSGGDRGVWTGVGWYRKHFRLPASGAGGRVFLQCDGLRQAGRFFLNGHPVGLSENGVTQVGLDLTPFARFGDAGENVLAVRVDNAGDYREQATGTPFQWNTNAFNPNYGGLNRDVRLVLTGPVYQTLPLFDGLGTTGVYVHAADFDVPGHRATVTVDAQVVNTLADNEVVTLSATVVDADGTVVATFASEPSDMVNGQRDVLTASGPVTGVRFWSPDDPHLYDVYTVLTVDGRPVDACRTRTGFRKVEFRGGAGTGGVWVNDRFVYLTGYAQRSSDSWPGLGGAFPDWTHDLTAVLMRDSHANYVRWMHVAPQRVDVEACDRAGLIESCPAGDKEKDVDGRQWEQRLEVMRDAIVSFRNAPSVLFWEAGNNGVSAEHLRQMVELRKKWDPASGRAMGCRTLTDPGTTPVAEYFGVMVGQDRRTDALRGPTDTFRAYSGERRDRAPLVETEDFRDEGARRFWDAASPPHFGFKPGPDDAYHWDSESFALASVRRYDEYQRNRISNADPAHAKWSGYASIYFSDANADGRQQSSEVCRVSGKVDAVRLPKEIYFASRVMQSPTPDLHVLGHWTYPPGTTKTVYVIAAHCDAVELLLNGKPVGPAAHATDGFVYAFPAIAFTPGTLRAVGTKGGVAVCTEQLQTAGPPVRLRLTPTTGPGGLRADGGDVALFDVEAIDAAGRRCPTDEARVDFALTGPADWRGGYNSGVSGSTNNLYVSTECGVNRVAVRARTTAGRITLIATRAGLAAATVTVESRPVPAGLAVLPPP